MTKTDVASTDAEKVSGRTAPKMIEPGDVVLQSGGYLYQSYIVRLPEGMIADDLRGQHIWERVQQRRAPPLRRHDRLYAIGFDESWAVEAIVTDATASAAVLHIGRVISFESRVRKLFEDDLYRIKWFGSGFACERKRDKQRVTEIVPNEELAERDLRRLYPKKAA